MIWTQLAQLLHIVDNVVAVHHTGLITIDDCPLALVIAANDGQTVCIWITCYYQVGIQSCTQVHTHCHRLGVLWVRTLYGWKITIYHHLLGHHMDILKAPRAQAHWHNMTTRTMQRSKHDIQIFLTENSLLINHHSLDCLHIIIIQLATDNLNKFFIAGHLHISHRHLIHLIDNALIMWLKYLTSILPICLIAIILFRVMTCGHIHTTLSGQMTNSKTNLWSRTQALKQIHLDSVRSKHFGYSLSIQTAVIAAVMTYYHTHYIALQSLKTTFFLNLQEIVCITLRRLSNHILIHTIRAWTHCSTQTACSKL